MIGDVFPLRDWSFETESVLKDLPLQDLEGLSRHMNDQQYAKGQIVFREGAYPTGIYYIREGKVKKFKSSKDGKEQIIYVAGSGELIGYHALLAEERYPDAAATLEDSSISFIPKEDFLEVLQHSKVLSQRLLKALSHEFSVFVNSVASLAHQNVRERFAMQLILLREKFKHSVVESVNVEIGMSREDLASLVGTTRENIIRIIKEFKEQGILETNGRKIIVKDVNRLLLICNY